MPDATTDLVITRLRRARSLLFRTGWCYPGAPFSSAASHMFEGNDEGQCVICHDYLWGCPQDEPEGDSRHKDNVNSLLFEAIRVLGGNPLV